ncbi:ATP synthase subunit e, mitochondrial [Diachasma alloeum]|uniref:ATP synthase F(0) complex subunit e, mitochondrial n=1 Tax=Diachasma alloeum TaxID=454923 RepID=A0A4E0S4D7_9HYME|nr:ATP synthase subunit e, mitochondrial [Diachasma alloeum]THK32863.1 E chain, ATP synthase [Diachasma alloeum]
MSSVELNPRPVRVSPLIKFGRWGMLVSGILYGAFHQNRLSKKETAWREVEAKKKVIRDKQLAEEKKRASAAEMASLEAMMK